MKKIIAYGAALLVSSLSLAETIYQSTDKRGNPVFTDQPQPSAKPIELKPLNTTPGITPSAPKEETAPVFAGYSKVVVTVPSSIPNGLAPTTVGIVTQPQLQSGHRWALLLDGQPQQQGTDSSATLGQLERGPHQLAVEILDENGRVIGNSPPADIFVYWPSKNR